MHSWGDKNFDWEGLDKAIDYIASNLRRWGRVPVQQAKEKFGTCRVYCSLGWHCLLDVTHPGYCHYRPYPNWLKTLDIFYLSKIIPGLFNWAVVPYHKWLYTKLYTDAVRKWPHLKQEIVCMADFPQLLKNIK